MKTLKTHWTRRFAAAALACSALSGCAQLQELTQPASVAPKDVKPLANNRVYRFCVGAECPVPAPKKPTPTMSVVNEIDSSGQITPVEQSLASFEDLSGKLPAPSGRTTIIGQKTPTPLTAQNDKAAAAVAAKLDEQRRAMLSGNASAMDVRDAITAPNPSMKGMGVPPVAPPAMPSIPAIPTPKQKPSPLQDILPTTGTRTPDKPQA